MLVEAKVWLNNNMPMHSVLAFWKWLWALQIPRKIITFLDGCVSTMHFQSWNGCRGKREPKLALFVGFTWNQCNMPYGTVWLHVLFGNVCCVSLMLTMDLM